MTDRESQDQDTDSSDAPKNLALGVLRSAVMQRVFGEDDPVRIGRYTILERIGAGTMGVVYGAYDNKLDRKIALKLLRKPAGEIGGEYRARMLGEARALAQLSHGNVVQVYDIGQWDDRVYIAMEFVRGQSLRQWLNSGERRPWQLKLETLLAAGRGLEAAHRADIIHRDFKLDNVIVSEKGGVRVLDFGLARPVRDPDDLEAEKSRSTGDHEFDEALDLQPTRTTREHGTSPLTSTRPLTREAGVGLTQTGAVVGTIAYMAPELLDGGEASTRSDQYAFCIALHEALFRCHPFVFSSAQQLINQQAENALVDPPHARTMPRVLLDIVRTGLARNPADRHPSMAALIDALEAASIPRWRRPKTLRWGIGLGLAAIALWIGRTQHVADAVAQRSALSTAIARVRAESDPLRSALAMAELAPAVAEHRRHRELNSEFATALQDVARWPLPVDVLRGHGSSPVRSIAYGPASKYLVTGGDDERALIWSLEHGSIVRELGPHGAEVIAVGYSPTGAFVATASDDDTARLWRADDGHLSCVYDGHDDAVTSLAFDPSGSLIATGSEDGEVHLWDQSCQTVARFIEHRDDVWCLEFAPDGSAIYSGANDGAVWSWHPHAPENNRLLGRHGAAVVALAVDRSGDRVYTSSEDRSIRIWSTTSAQSERMEIIRFPDSVVTSLAVDPGGERIVIGTDDHRIRVWDRDFQDEPIELRGHRRALNQLQFSPDGRSLASASRDGDVRIWRSDFQREPLVLSGHRAAVRTAAFARGSELVVSGGEDGEIRVWDVATRTTLHRLDAAAGSVTEIFVDPERQPRPDADAIPVIRSAHEDGKVRYWSPAHEQALVLNAHSTWIESLHVQGNSMVTASSDESLAIWRPTGATEPGDGVILHTDSHRLTVARLTPDGMAVVFGRQDGALLLLGVEDDAPPRTLGQHDAAINDIDIAPDGESVVVAANDGSVWLWKTGIAPTRKGAAPRPWTALRHESPVHAVKFSHRGDAIATAGDDAVLRIWALDEVSGANAEPAHDHPSVILRGHGDRITDVAFSADDSRLVTSSDDRSVRVWSRDADGLVDRLRAKTRSCLTAEDRVRLLGEDARSARRGADECAAQRGLGRGAG